MIRFATERCRDLGAAMRLEWLEANGLGGFASSTIAAVNTRRYHGILMAALNPPVGRMLLLARVEETLVVGGERFELAVNQYPGVIHPEGYRWLTEFRLAPFPVFTYAAGGVELEKSVVMVHGENTTLIHYEVRAAGDAAAGREMHLEVRPLIAFRDYHATTHRNDALDARVEQAPGIASVAPYAGLPALHLAHDADQLDTAGDWYLNCEYELERERGLDFREDLFRPCTFHFDLRGRHRASIIASTLRHDAGRAAELRRAEVARRAALLEGTADDEDLRTLASAADAYVVARGDHRSVIAGYPWFADWGRDTFIALRGLCLATGRLDVARDVLLAWSRTVSQGMLPNRFPDQGETPELNSVDASLWYVVAVHDFLESMRRAGRAVDAPDLAALHGAVDAILDGYARGTRYGIGVDQDGLLLAGEPGVQLTWMDAKVGDWVVTPRIGKPVEVQALWLNALHLAGRTSPRWRVHLERGRTSFDRRFWNEPGGFLYDVVDCDRRAGTADPSFRPNQILAVGGLPLSLLDPPRARRVVDAVESRLWTPLGLRSLAPGEPGYVARYEGGVRERDSSYHQGTVWPWLAGPFVEAWVRVRGETRQAKREARERFLAPLLRHLHDAGLGHVSEIADGDAPHTPRGCPFQAWSVGEALRLANRILAD